VCEREGERERESGRDRKTGKGKIKQEASE